MFKDMSLNYNDFNAIAATDWDKNNIDSTEENQKKYYQNAWQLVSKMRNKSRLENRLRIFKRILTGTASVAAVCAIGWFVYTSVIANNSSDELVYKEVVTDKGEIKDVILPDGSLIKLNASSTLRYDQHYGKHDRNVTLTGEAFFDVKSDKTKPFIINSDKLSVRVMGTSFNIRSYPEDITTSVAVRSGKVGVDFDHDEINIKLRSGDQIVIDKTNLSMSRQNVNVNNSISWMSGNLYFSELPIREAVKMLRRHYDANIILKDSSSKAIITGMHDNKSLESVLKSICFTANLKFDKKNGTYTIY